MRWGLAPPVATPPPLPEAKCPWIPPSIFRACGSRTYTSLNTFFWTYYLTSPPPPCIPVSVRLTSLSPSHPILLTGQGVPQARLGRSSQGELGDPTAALACWKEGLCNCSDSLHMLPDLEPGPPIFLRSQISAACLHFIRIQQKGHK